MPAVDYDALGERLNLQDPVLLAQPWLPPDSQPPEGVMRRLRPGALPVRPLVLVGGFAANGLMEGERQHGRIYRGKQIWPPFHFDPVNGDWSLHPVS